MEIKDLLELGRGKIRDFKSKVMPKGYFEESVRVVLNLKGKDPASDKFAEAFEEFWLFNIRQATYQETLHDRMKAIVESSRNVEGGKDLVEYLGRTSLEFRARSDAITQVRTNYRLWREGQQDYSVFEDSLRGALTLNKQIGVTQ